MTRLMIILEATLGGIRKHVHDLIEGLDKERFDITFVYSIARADSVFINDLDMLAGSEVRLVEIPMGREIGFYSEIRALLRLKHLVSEIQPDIIHAHGAKAGALGRITARLCGVRHVVYTPHGGAFHKFSGIKGLIYLGIEKFLSFLCKTDYIGVSKDSCRQIRESLKVPEASVHLVYNGIDTTAINRTIEDSVSARQSFDPESIKYVVLYPAVFLEAKGHLEFIEAIGTAQQKLLPQILFVLAGDGPLRDSICSMIDEYNLAEHFYMAGFITDIYTYYKACDLVILPSRSEVFGYVLLEAMASGKPVVATDAGAIPEIVQHGVTGETVSLDRLTDMVEVINRLATDKNLAACYGQNAQRIASQAFSTSMMIGETENIYCALK